MEQQTLQEEKKPKVYEEIFKYGLILGIVFFVFGLISLYLMQSSDSFLIMTIAYPVIFQLIIPLVFVIFLCISLRKQIGGYWTFKQALKSIFLVFFIGWLFSFGLNLAYTKLIDTSIMEKTQDHMKESFVAFMKKQSMEDEKIDKEVAKLDEQFAKQNEFSAKTAFRNITIAVSIIFVIALIFAAIFKRERPLRLEDFPTQA
ncbi:DUF4199 domain-containing protein [Pedobacter sp. MR2016-19]|uniref:DUF4199 domain-containing protein n=1 Tax=Pedobacter sp. MR2016-19 TaxID=2780089 RepID=UPI001873BAF1|nr:DUF4199 domain-containing protein [Pedobacter sp. MR2016-19]MBE5320366.1 DUF4199 domain-containing protein [Pedobacter sp. MR2016-19]